MCCQHYRPAPPNLLFHELKLSWPGYAPDGHGPVTHNSILRLPLPPLPPPPSPSSALNQSPCYLKLCTVAHLESQGYESGMNGAPEDGLSQRREEASWRGEQGGRGGGMVNVAKPC